MGLDSSFSTSTIREIYKDKDTYFFDLKGQRSFVWDHFKRSLLIDSILRGWGINLLHVNRTSEGILEVLDGKQRYKSIITFIDNEWALSDKIDYCNGEYSIANKKFIELSQDLKDKIFDYATRAEVYYNLPEEDKNEILSRLNMGESMSVMDEIRVHTQGKKAEFIDKIATSDFYNRKVSMQKSDVSKNSVHEESVYFLLIMEIEKEPILTQIRAKKFADKFKDEFPRRATNTVEKVVDYMNLCFPTKHKFLTRSNTPVVYVVAKKAMKDGCNPKLFLRIIDSFMDNMSEDYRKDFNRRKGASHTIKDKVDELMNYYESKTKNASL